MIIDYVSQKLQAKLQYSLVSSEYSEDLSGLALSSKA